MFSADFITRNVKWLALFFILIIAVSFKFETGNGLLMAELLFIGYLSIILIVLSSGAFKYLYEPPIYVLGFAFIYEFLKFPYYFAYETPDFFLALSDLQDANYSVQSYYAASSQLLAYQALCLVVLLGAYFMVRKLRPEHNGPSSVFTFRHENYLLFVMIALWFICLIYFLRLTSGNFLFLLTRRAGNPMASDLLKSNYILSLLSTLVLALFPVLITLKILAKKKWRWLFLLFIPAAALSFLVTGARGPAIYSLVASLVLLNALKQLNLKSTLPILLLLMLMFGLLGLIRRSASLISESGAEALVVGAADDNKWYLGLSTYQTQLRDEMVFSNLNNSNMLSGSSYLNLVFFAVPKRWAPTLKPVFTDQYVGQHFFGKEDTGLPLNSMTESYLNFSYLGIVVFIFWGCIMGLVTNYLQTTSIPIAQCLAIVLLIYSQTWYTTYLVYSLQLLLFIGPMLMLIRTRRPA